MTSLIRPLRAVAKGGSADINLLAARAADKIELLEQSLASCILVIHGSEPIDKSKAEYYRQVVAKAYALLGKGDGQD